MTEGGNELNERKVIGGVERRDGKTELVRTAIFRSENDSVQKKYRIAPGLKKQMHINFTFGFAENNKRKPCYGATMLVACEKFYFP